VAIPGANDWRWIVARLRLQPGSELQARQRQIEVSGVPDHGAIGARLGRDRDGCARGQSCQRGAGIVELPQEGVTDSQQAVVRWKARVLLYSAFVVHEKGKEPRTIEAGSLYRESMGNPMEARNASATRSTRALIMQVGNKGEPLMIQTHF